MNNGGVVGWIRNLRGRQMTKRHFSLCGLGFFVVLLHVSPSAAQPPRTENSPRPMAEVPLRTRTASSINAAQVIPFDALEPAVRDRLRKVVNQPTLVTHAEAAEFKASPKTYEWLL